MKRILGTMREGKSVIDSIIIIQAEFYGNQVQQTRVWNNEHIVIGIYAVLTKNALHRFHTLHITHVTAFEMCVLYNSLLAESLKWSKEHFYSWLITMPKYFF